MQTCSGITRNGVRCSNKAKYETTICKATFKVCKHHQNKRLLSLWENEITRRMCSPDDIPKDVEKWIHLFHEVWKQTKNIYVSANFATAVFRHADIENYNFNS